MANHWDICWITVLVSAPVCTSLRSGCLSGARQPLLCSKSLNLPISLPVLFFSQDHKHPSISSSLWMKAIDIEPGRHSECNWERLCFSSTQEKWARWFMLLLGNKAASAHSFCTHQYGHCFQVQGHKTSVLCCVLIWFGLLQCLAVEPCCTWTWDPPSFSSWMLGSQMSTTTSIWETYIKTSMLSLIVAFWWSDYNWFPLCVSYLF